MSPGEHGLLETFNNPFFFFFFLSFSLVKRDCLSFERNVTRAKLIFISLDLGDNDKEAFLRALLFSLIRLFKCYSKNHQRLNLTEIAFHVWLSWEVKIHQKCGIK